MDDERGGGMLRKTFLYLAFLFNAFSCIWLDCVHIRFAHQIILCVPIKLLISVINFFAALMLHVKVKLVDQ